MIVDGRPVCDECGLAAPDAATVLDAHGLDRLGWYCWGGYHACPAHAPHYEEKK